MIKGVEGALAETKIERSVTRTQGERKKSQRVVDKMEEDVHISVMKTGCILRSCLIWGPLKVMRGLIQDKGQLKPTDAGIKRSPQMMLPNLASPRMLR